LALPPFSPSLFPFQTLGFQVKQTKMNKPKIIISWIYGIIAMSLFTGIYVLILYYPPFSTPYALLGLLVLFMGVSLGEIIHIHRKLNAFEEEEEKGGE